MLLQFENDTTNRTIVTQMNRPTPEFSSLFAWVSSPLRMVEPLAQVGSEIPTDPLKGSEDQGSRLYTTPCNLVP
jgi:hypothetical protein